MKPEDVYSKGRQRRKVKESEGWEPYVNFYCYKKGKVMKKETLCFPQSSIFCILVICIISFYNFTARAALKNNINLNKSQLPNIVVLTTGGTIAEKIDPATGGAVPAVSGNDLIAAVPGLEKIANISVVEFCNIDSSQMTPAIWRNISIKADKILKNPEIDGMVITHGTDTMAEGAFFLETTLKSTKPVVFTGAMRSASDLSPDGPANLYNAVLQAGSQVAKDWGVTLVLNQYINSARYVIKDNTTNVQTFDSGDYGYLGYIVGKKVIPLNLVLVKRKVPLTKQLPEVPLFFSYAGDNGRHIRHAVDTGAKGLVVIGVGAGNVNEEVFKAIKYALSKNIPVVAGSRVRHGGIYALYGDKGGGTTLVSAGVILSGDLSPFKARLLLMLAIAQKDMTIKKIKELFKMK